MFCYVHPTFIIFSLWVFCGCQPTNRSVIAEYQARVAPLREKVQRIAAKVQNQEFGESESSAGNLTPKPVFSVQPENSNTAIMNLQNALDPASDYHSGEAPDFGLRRDNDLRDVLLYTGPNSPWNDTALSQDGRRLAKQCERALGLKYLVLVRVVTYQPPVAATGDQFTGGVGEFEAYLADLDREAILSRVRFTAGPVEQVEYVTVEGKFRKDDPKERLVAFARSAVKTQGEKNLAEQLQKATGGEFGFAERREQ